MSNKEKFKDYPSMTISQFQNYLIVALEEMVLRDNCFPKVENFGVLGFNHMQISEEHGCVITFKDGSSFLLKISDITIPNSCYVKNGIQEDLEQENLEEQEDLEDLVEETEESD